MVGEGKRKRSSGELCDNGLKKRGKWSIETTEHALQAPDAVNHPVLAQCYPRLQTLRQYVLCRLPATSKIRRKKITAIGSSLAGGEAVVTDRDQALGTLLDSTIVGLPHEDETEASWDALWADWISASQKGDESYITLRDGAVREQSWPQADIVDSVIWCLFERAKKGRVTAAGKADVRPAHLLCDGYRSESRRQSKPLSSIPGLFAVFPNQRVQILKQSPWTELLTLLGSAGERIMRDLLLNGAIFTCLAGSRNNYWQLSGVSLAAQDGTDGNTFGTRARGEQGRGAIRNTPNNITFVRSRILYARAALNAKGSVSFGLRHVHVINRFPISRTAQGEPGTSPIQTTKDGQDLLRVMMYVFPRQFGLHNVFTSKVDKKKTTQKLQDYTMREEEIAARFGTSQEDGAHAPRLPKRLRGKANALVQKLRILHTRCSYTELLHHYCPTQPSTRPENDAMISRSSGRWQSQRSYQPDMGTAISSLTELATPASQVSSFCRAVLSKLVPRDFWGQGTVASENLKAFLHVVDRFVRLRRFESMSLHDALQGLKILGIEWLGPPAAKGSKMCLPETRKREEIFHEFIYYLIDSLLIPLIRSNFYVTESSVHRYKLFFFRHDVWRHIAEPAMAALRTKMFEEVKLEDALRLLERRELGFSQVRLLPKQMGMRPIMNLRRRTFKQDGRMVLGSSINALLAPVQSVLNLERTWKPEKLGSALFSVGDIYTRIRDFKSRLAAAGGLQRKLYFAKVDVQAAFDTIPQSTVLELVKKIPSRRSYSIIKYLEIQDGHGTQLSHSTSRKWASLAKSASDDSRITDLIEKTVAAKRNNSLFIDSAMQKSQARDALLELLSSHIEQNLVKIGKKLYRQKDGIPQGSVLSSLLCSYFYADLEAKRLAFLQSEDCLLLRLIDDFLLITTDNCKAAQFMQVMHAGVPEYGVSVNQNKSLANFAHSHNGQAVPRLAADHHFPYCGTLLDCTTLEISKDRTSPKDPVVFNALTVESSRAPGQTFKRKVLNSFRIQSAHMFFDTAHNELETVLRNIYTAFVETAGKMWAYARSMPSRGQPGEELVLKTIQDVIGYAYGLITSKTRKQRWPGYECSVRRSQVEWLAYYAFRNVLGQKQARYRGVLAKMDGELRQLSLLIEVTTGPTMQVVHCT